MIWLSRYRYIYITTQERGSASGPEVSSTGEEIQVLYIYVYIYVLLGTVYYYDNVTPTD